MKNSSLLCVLPFSLPSIFLSLFREKQKKKLFLFSFSKFIWYLVDSNSSSFSASLRSISCLTWVSSSWARSTLFSSCSNAPSASASAASSSSFSASRRFRILSISWMERPPSLIWSMMSLISVDRKRFSLLTCKIYYVPKQKA